MENNAHPQVGSKRPLSETISQPSQQALAVSSAPPPAASAAAAAAPGSSSVATTASNGGAAVAGSDDPKPGRSKAAYGPDMRILEVTNNGDPANMEMLIHLKVRGGSCTCSWFWF